MRFPAGQRSALEPTARRSRTRRRLAITTIIGVLASGLTGLGSAAMAAPGGTTLFNQNFLGSTVSPTGGAVKLLPVPSGSVNVACLTASSNTSQTPIPGCGGTPDADGSGALRLTSAGNSLVGATFASTSIPTANGLDIRFDTYQYGGSSADGIAFVLAAVDPKNPQPPAKSGPLGGSLGYSATPSIAGFSYGYLGIGLDVYGNYSNTQFMGSGCPADAGLWPTGAQVQNQLVVRGPGNGLVGYCGLQRSAVAMHGTTRANSKVPVHIVIDPTTRKYTVTVTPVGGGSNVVLTGDLPTAAGKGFPADWLDANGLPKQLAFGWTASTGGSTDVHEINVTGGVTTVTSLTPAPVLSGTQTYVGSRAPSGTGTLTLRGTVGSTADENKPISVTTTLPTGITPTGIASGTTGWTCAAPSGQSVTCTTTGSSFPAGTTLPPLVVATRIGSGTMSDAILATGKATLSSDDASPALIPTTVVPLPAAPALLTSGRGIAAQTVAVAVPTSGSATLLDSSGNEVTSLTIANKGTYSYASGAITFRPVLGYTGTVTGARYKVTDSYGQTSTGTVTSTVNAPEAPVATPVTSTGAGTEVQRFTPNVPDGGSVSIDGATGTSVQTLTVNGQGTYRLDRTTGIVTFTPVLGYTGTATPATYRLTDAYGTSSTSTYTPTVINPDGPTAAALASSGTGTTTQQVNPVLPASGSLTLLGGGGTAETAVTVAGQGVYRLSGSALTFTPQLGYTGTADSVSYRVTDAYGLTAVATYTATVGAPSGPQASRLGTSGVGTDPQTVNGTVPVGGSLALVSGGTTQTSVTVPGKGTFSVSGSTLTFVPELGFVGDATATYRVTDAYAQTADSTYTATVTVPAGPSAAALGSTGVATAPQHATATKPTGGAVTLLNPSAAPVTSVTLDAAQGTYAIDPATGEITFTPVLGFSGPATPVTYRLTDAYQQASGATYTPKVIPPAPPTAQPRTATLVDPNGSGTDPQAFTVADLLPTGGTATLLNGSGAPVTTLTVAGQGVWTLNAAGAGTFTPALGFAGSATPVTYRITDAYGQNASATVDATVKAPDALLAPPVFSSGVGTAVQRVQLLLPADGAVTLRNGASDTTSITNAQATYVLDTATGVLSITPVLGFTGQATAIGYRIRDVYGTWSNVASVTATVDPPAAPVRTDLTSTGVGTAVQQVTLPTAPAGGSVAMRDGNADATQVTVAQQGTYRFTGTGISFTPVLGFAGTASPVSYRVTDAYGQTGTSTYTPTVTAPAGPTPGAVTSTGVGTAPQTIQLPTTPASGQVRLVGSGGTPTLTVVVAGEGTYVLDPVTAIVTFTPVLGFAGTAAPVTYQHTDAYQQVATSTITATVTAPAGPAPSPVTSTGVGTAPQTIQLPATPASGQVRLVGSGGTPTLTVVVAGEGTYVLDPVTAIVTFTPVLGFAGTATPVTYRHTDAYQQVATSTITATVTAPAGPAPSPVTSTGIGTSVQSIRLPATPDSGQVRLLASDGTPTVTLVVAGEGRYVLDPAAEVVTFTPVLGFAGTATPVSYRQVDAYQQVGTSTITATVTAPGLLGAAPLTSTGVGTAPQSLTLALPLGGGVTLLDGTSPTTMLQRTEALYLLDATTGTLTVTPTFGYAGTAAPVAYRVTDAYGQTSESTVTVTVTPPAGPTATDRDSTGVGTTPQSVTLPAAPVGGRIALVGAAGEDVLAVTVPGQGSYALDLSTDVVTFTPVLGFAGAATPATYRVTDAYGQTALAAVRPVVTRPAAPATPTVTPVTPPVTGNPGPGTPANPSAPVTSVAVAIPDGGSIVLLGSDGKPLTTLTVPGKGTYVLDPVTGTISFTPVAGFSGKVPPVTFQVTDAYGQAVTGTYAATVSATNSAKAGLVMGRTSVITGRGTVPATCTTSVTGLARCQVRLTAWINRKTVLLGTGVLTPAAGGSRGGSLSVTLTKAGKALASRPGGVLADAKATATLRGLSASLTAATRTRLVARQVTASPVFFATDSAMVSKAQAKQLKVLRTELAGVRAITCIGNTDSREPASYNARLGKARAQAVCAALAKGLHVKVKVVTRGETRPAKSNSTATGRAYNRRTDIQLTY